MTTSFYTFSSTLFPSEPAFEATQPKVLTALWMRRKWNITQQYSLNIQLVLSHHSWYLDCNTWAATSACVWSISATITASCSACGMSPQPHCSVTDPGSRGLPITNADMLLVDSAAPMFVLLVAVMTVRVDRWFERSDIREGTTSKLKRSQRYSDESPLPPGFRIGNGTR